MTEKDESASPEAEKLESVEIKGCEFVNLSGQQLEKAINFFPHDLKAEKVVLLPDLCPGRAPIPTGCAVEINFEKHGRDWQKFAISDVGCGMQVVETTLTWDEFESRKDLWDQIYERLRANRNQGLGDLGSGNHFMDAAVTEDGQVYFVCHTGSRDESKKVEGLVGNQKNFDRVFNETVSWARDNRSAISAMLADVYGKESLKVVLDKSHNGYEYTKSGVIIRKGAVRLEEGELTLIPSSMNGQMALVKGTNQMGEILHSMSHGTGRVESRAASKKGAEDFDFEGLRRAIYIPEGISNASITTERPECYRGLDACLEILGGTVTVDKRLSPIAYIGQT